MCLVKDRILARENMCLVEDRILVMEMPQEKKILAVEGRAVQCLLVVEGRAVHSLQGAVRKGPLFVETKSIYVGCAIRLEWIRSFSSG